MKILNKIAQYAQSTKVGPSYSRGLLYFTIDDIIRSANGLKFRFVAAAHHNDTATYDALYRIVKYPHLTCLSFMAVPLRKGDGYEIMDSNVLYDLCNFAMEMDKTRQYWNALERKMMTTLMGFSFEFVIAQDFGKDGEKYAPLTPLLLTGILNNREIH